MENNLHQIVAPIVILTQKSSSSSTYLVYIVTLAWLYVGLALSTKLYRSLPVIIWHFFLQFQILLVSDLNLQNFNSIL